MVRAQMDHFSQNAIRITQLQAAQREKNVSFNILDHILVFGIWFIDVSRLGADCRLSTHDSQKNWSAFGLLSESYFSVTERGKSFRLFRKNTTLSISEQYPSCQVTFQLLNEFLAYAAKMADIQDVHAFFSPLEPQEALLSSMLWSEDKIKPYLTEMHSSKESPVQWGKQAGELLSDLEKAYLLYEAVKLGKGEIALFLLEEWNANPNLPIPHCRHRTALHIASKQIRKTGDRGVKCVEALLDYGARCVVLDAEGCSPLDLFSSRKHHGLLRRLQFNATKEKEVKWVHALERCIQTSYVVEVERETLKKKIEELRSAEEGGNIQENERMSLPFIESYNQGCLFNEAKSLTLSTFYSRYLHAYDFLVHPDFGLHRTGTRIVLVGEAVLRKDERICSSEIQHIHPRIKKIQAKASAYCFRREIIEGKHMGPQLSEETIGGFFSDRRKLVSSFQNRESTIQEHILKEKSYQDKLTGLQYLLMFFKDVLQRIEDLRLLLEMERRYTDPALQVRNKLLSYFPSLFHEQGVVETRTRDLTSISAQYANTVDSDGPPASVTTEAACAPWDGGGAPHSQHIQELCTRLRLTSGSDLSAEQREQALYRARKVVQRVKRNGVNSNNP